MDALKNVVFLKDGEMPQKPEKPNRAIFAYDKVIGLKPVDKAVGWQPTWHGQYNPAIGRIEHEVVCTTDNEGNPVAWLYDQMSWYDGKTNPEGGYFQSEVFVPIFQAPEDPDDSTSPLTDWVLWFWEYRTSFEDWCQTVPGGFEPAKQEALEEAGLVIKLTNSMQICMNRANVRTMVKFGFGAFEIGDNPNPEKLESIFSKVRFATPLSSFPTTLDGHVNQAIGLAREKLGYTNQKRELNVAEAMEALKRALLAES